MSLPIIKIEIEQMRHAIMHAFTEHQFQVSEEVERQLEHVIQNYNYEAAIRDAAYKAMDEAIKNYFGYGEGYQIIHSAINESLNKMFKK